MADEDFEDELLLGSGQESPADRWLTDEEYASGKWYRFALERLLPMAQSTRLTTAQMEFLARSGWICYVPRYVWMPRYVETNEYARDEKKIWPLFNEDGSSVVIRGRIAFMQGSDQIPRFVAETNTGNEWWGRKFISEVLKLGRRGGNPSKDLKDLYFENGDIGEKRCLAEDTELVKARYWIPTPILGESFVQSPRLPFDMVPKIHLEFEYTKQTIARVRSYDKAILRNIAALNGDPFEATSNEEFVDYQYCGCPAFDEELIRAFRTNSEPRPKKIAWAQALIDAGVEIWRLERKAGVITKIQVARWVENAAGITIRVHRQVAENYITAKQVFEGLERLKRHYFDPNVAEELRYKPVPDVPDGFPEIDGIVLGDLSGVDVLVIEKLIKWLLVKLAKTDPIQAARLQRTIRKQFEDWIEVHYDRTLPNEQLRYREWFYDLQALSGSDWASQADRWHYQLQLRIHFKKAPGIISSTSQRANFLDMELQVADFESWRNLEHMQEHWKYSKAMQNTLASFDDDRTSPKNMRQRDWGGIWNPIKAMFDWRWNKLNELGPKNQPEQRRSLLGPAWFDREPWQMLDHDGSMIDRFGQKKVGWVKSMRDIKGLSSAAGAFSFPRRKQGDLDKTLAEFRDYPSEYLLLVNDEYFARDPVDVMENQKGIVIFSVLNDVNLRLKARYNERRFPAFHLTYDNCCAGATFVQRMWKLQPVGPVKKAIEGSMIAWKRKNIDFFREEIDRLLDGVYINRDIRRELEKWYRQSDERYLDFVFWYLEMMSTMTEPGAAMGFGPTPADKANKAGFGLGYGPVQMQQARQEMLMEVGLYTDYFTVIKGFVEWWSVIVTATKLFDERSWPDKNMLKQELANLLKSRKLIYHVAENILWPLLHVKSLIPDNMPFPIRLREVDIADKGFVFDYLNQRLGVDYIPTAEEAEASEIMRAVRDEALVKNQERYNRIATGRFFEVNN